MLREPRGPSRGRCLRPAPPHPAPPRPASPQSAGAFWVTPAWCSWLLGALGLQLSPGGPLAFCRLP